MKKLLVLIALVVPLVAEADPQPHDIITGVHFGMPLLPARNALLKFQSSTIKTGSEKLRHHFITSVSLQSGKLTATDKLVPVSFVPNTGPIFNSLKILSVEQRANGYESLRTAWSDFKDIADSKFKRLGGSGTFPEITEFGTVDKDVTTDSYEAEGMHIDLIVHSRTFEKEGTFYGALLDVTPATPVPAK